MRATNTVEKLARTGSVFARMRAVRIASGILLLLPGRLLFAGSLSRFDSLTYAVAARLDRCATRFTLRAVLLPAPIALAPAFPAISVLAFAGIVDIPSLISSWLRLQGI